MAGRERTHFIVQRTQFNIVTAVWLNIMYIERKLSYVVVKKMSWFDGLFITANKQIMTVNKG